MPRCKHKLTGEIREYHVYRRGYAMPEWCRDMARVLYDGDVIIRHPNGNISYCAPHTFDEWYEVIDDEPQRFTYHDYGRVPQWFTDWLKSKRDVKLCHNGSIIVDGAEIRPGDTLHYDAGKVKRTTPLTNAVMKLQEMHYVDTARRIIAEECEKKAALAVGDDMVMMRAVMRALKGDY